MGSCCLWAQWDVRTGRGEINAAATPELGNDEVLVALQEKEHAGKACKISQGC